MDCGQRNMLKKMIILYLKRFACGQFTYRAINILVLGL